MVPGVLNKHTAFFLPCQAAQEDCATLQSEGIMILWNIRNYSCDI